MYLSVNWIKDWLKLPKEITPAKLAHDLTMSTVEVEEVVDQAAKLEGIIVGKVKEITKHPQADRLQVCQVNIGEQDVQIVCGGSNLTKNMLVAVATVGSSVRWHGEGDWVTLEKVKIRGVASFGMIAAASEIGLSNLFPAKSDKEILDLSDFKLRAGESLASALKIDDFIIDIDNKSINHRPDLWGQYGLTREVAAIYRTKLKDYQAPEIVTKKDEAKLKVTIKDKDSCFRYLGLVIKDVTITSSPWWLQARLQAVGIRPVNNIVDVTNYVMYELGQPLHAFDARQVDNYQIEVKTAKKGEKFVTLDGEKRKLADSYLMIADRKKYIALAGIMGGQNSEIGSDTTEIILESANFQASNIRQTSTALGLRSESSARFEKSLDPKLAELAIKKAAELILKLNDQAYVASKLVDVDHNPFTEINLVVSEKLINQRFGVEIPQKDIKDILTRLQFEVKFKAGNFDIKVPSFRATKDISIPEDIVEEVARIYGYDNIQASLPKITMQEPIIDVALKAARDIRYWLSQAQGYSEIYTYPFTDLNWVEKLGLDLKDHIKVTKSVSPEQAYLNTSLLPNLLRKAEENLRFFDQLQIFELNRVFDKHQKSIYPVDSAKKKFLPLQDRYLSGVVVSSDRAQDAFLKIKGLIESLQDYAGIDLVWEESRLTHSQLTYVIKHQDVVLGQCGLLKNDLFDSGAQSVQVTWWEFNFSVLVKYLNRVKDYQPLAKFPSVNRDVAVVVAQGVYWSELEKEIYKISPLIVNIDPFDVFAGQGVPAGKKSIAFHLELRSIDKTLESEDADNLIVEILAILSKKFKATLRE
jgi:phenylalanyl-tRNA synthetase beta chain